MIGGKATRGDEHVNVRMKQHGARPGVKDRKCSDTRAEITRILGEFLQSVGRGFHQQAVDFLWMGTGKGTQFRRQGKGHQKIGTG